MAWRGSAKQRAGRPGGPGATAPVARTETARPVVRRYTAPPGPAWPRPAEGQGGGSRRGRGGRRLACLMASAVCRRTVALRGTRPPRATRSEATRAPRLCQKVLAATATMSVSFAIMFDRPHAAYFAGETVSGRVVLRSAKAKRLGAVTLSLRGEARVHWTETETRHHGTTSSTSSRGSTTSTDTIHYRADEVYFEQSMYFAGGATGEVTLGAGEHSFDFSFTLPAALPSSFEGVHGYIRYTAKALMHRPWKFDHGAKAAFTVVAPLDLNTLPHTRTPVEREQSKHMCCLWCRSGPLTVNVRLPASGFVPGETILVQIQIDNASNSAVRKIYFALDKEVRWHAMRGGFGLSKTKESRHTVVEVAFDEGVAAHGSRALAQIVVLPPLPPANTFSLCKIIDVQYTMRVLADVVGCHGDLEVRTPVVIGTIPFVSTPTPAEVVVAPTAPPFPTPYPDLPPPSYEECVFKGNNIMDGDGDNEYTMGVRDFTPRYPVYAFQPHHG